MLFRLILAGLGAVCGYSVFISFIILKNYPSAILGVITGLSESVIFVLHYLVRKGHLQAWYTQEQLRQICRLGIIIGLVGLLNLGYHTTIQIMYQKPIMPIPKSSVIPIVWSLVVTRSGISMMYYCIRYQNNDYVRLLATTNEDTTGEDEIVSSTSQDGQNVEA